MLKSMLALMAAGILGTGVPLAQQAATRTVAIDDLTLVGESGSVVPGAEQEQYHYHHGGYHHGGYHYHGGYHHGGYHHHHGGYHHHHGGYHHHHGGYHYH